jgi:hypothetical protein
MFVAKHGEEFEALFERMAKVVSKNEPGSQNFYIVQTFSYFKNLFVYGSIVFLSTLWLAPALLGYNSGFGGLDYMGKDKLSRQMA